MRLLTPVYVFASKFTPVVRGLSGGKPLAGCVVSPRRSRTMSSYSTREMRRTGDQSTVGAPGVHDAAKSPTPIDAGASVTGADDASPPTPVVSWPGNARCRSSAQPATERATATHDARALGRLRSMSFVTRCRDGSREAHESSWATADAEARERDVVEPQRHRLARVALPPELEADEGRLPRPGKPLGADVRHRGAVLDEAGDFGAVHPGVDRPARLVDVKLDARPRGRRDDHAVGDARGAEGRQRRVVGLAVIHEDGVLAAHAHVVVAVVLVFHGEERDVSLAERGAETHEEARVDL